MNLKFKSLPYIPLRITSPFGKRDVSGIKGATPWHDGVDIGRDKNKYSSAPAGNIFAVMDGIIVERDYNRYRGYYIKIKHPDVDGHTIETLYQHMHSEGLPLKTVVKAGQPIGRMGQSGVGSGIHLHFELRIDGKCVDPLPYLKTVGKKRSKYYERVQKLTKFEESSMDYLNDYDCNDELFFKIINGKPLNKRSVDFILKHKYGEEIIRRIKDCGQ